MKKLFIFALVLLILIGSTSIFALSSEYSNYDANEFKYSNSAIKFSIVFDDSWNVYPSFDATPEQYQNLLKQQINPENFLYFGLTKNQAVGCRGLVEEVNMDLDDYFAAIKDVNAKAITNVRGKKVKINDIPMVYWTYEVPGSNIIYAEYIFKKDTYDVRLSFWTLKSLFNKYSHGFEDIMKTLQEE